MSDLKQLGYGVYLDIDQLQKQAKRAEQSFRDMSNAAGKQGKSMSDAVAKSSNNIGQNLGAMVGKFASVTAAVGFLVKTLKSLVDTNMSFERKASEMAAVLGTTKEGVKELTDAARELGRYTEFTATQVEELQIALARLGFTNQQILAMQKPVLQFAQAVGADLGEAANFAGATLRAFGMDATQTTHLLDVLSASTSKSALDFSKLNASMSTIAPVAYAFGLSLEDTTTFLGALSNAGFDASSAATAMRNILLNLADANGALAKGLGHTANTFPEIIASLKECTEKGLDLNSTLEMTDKRSVAAFNALISGADDANKLREALGNCDGTLQTMSDTMADNLMGAVKGLQSAWEGLLLRFQESNGPMSDVVRGLTNIINKVSDLAGSKEIKQNEKKQETKAQAEDYINRLYGEYNGDVEAIQKRIADDQQNAQNNYFNAIEKAVHAKGNRAKKQARDEVKLWMDIQEMLKQTQEPLIQRMEWEESKKGKKNGNTDGNTTTTKILTDDEKKAIENAAKQLAQAQKDMWMAVETERIAAMKEGTQKRLEEIENERKQTIDAIDKEQKQLEELAKKAGKKVDAKTYEQFEERRGYANDKADNDRADVEAEQAKYVEGLYKQSADVFVSEEQRKIDAIHKTYDEQRKQLDNDLAGGTITKEQHTELKSKLNSAEQKEIKDSWIQSFGSYQQRLDALKEEWANRMKDIPAEFADEANKQMNAAISDFIINNSEAKSAITRLFDDMTEKSVSDLRKIAAEGQQLYDFLSSGTWDSSIGEKLNITEEQFNTLRKSPQELEKIRKAIKGINDEADSNDTIFKQFSAGLKDIFAAGDNGTKLQKGLENVGGAVSKASAVVSVLSSAFESIANGSGNEAMKSVADGLGVAMDAMGSAMEGAQAGSAFGPWGAAAGAAIGLVTSLYENISKLHDKNIQKRIEDLQKEIDDEGDAYERLSELADKAFGKNKADYIEQQNANLQHQNELIQQQIDEEESKKNSNSEVVDELNQKMEENNRLIEENKEAAMDAIFGSDISSAINEFADAIAEAWTNGEKGATNAKNQVRSMMRQMVIEAVKAYVQASGQMERIREAMQQAIADDVITDEERKNIETMAENLANEVENKYGWAQNLFDDSKREGAKGTGIAASQESVDNLDGRMTTIQGHTYSLVQGQQELIRVSNAILDRVAGIEENTGRSEGHLDTMQRDINSMKNTIDDISLKGVRIRN